MTKFKNRQKVLLIGASRGLGLAIVEEFLTRGYFVVATVRVLSNESLINNLIKLYPDQLIVDLVDITKQQQIDDLYERCKGYQFDILFVNSGVKNADTETVADVAIEV